MRGKLLLAGRILCRALFALGMTCLVAGCGQVYTVKVDAIRTPEFAPRRSYHLIAAESARDPNDPLFIEALAVVGRALDESGMFAASRPEWADMVIEVDLGISPRRMVAVPDRQAADATATAIYLPERSGGTVGETSGVQAPAGQVKRIVFVWEKRLSVVACENATVSTRIVRGGAELWRVDLSLEDSFPGLDGLLPVLASALPESVDRDLPPSTVRYVSASVGPAMTMRAR